MYQTVERSLLSDALHHVVVIQMSCMWGGKNWTARPEGFDMHPKFPSRDAANERNQPPGCDLSVRSSYFYEKPLLGHGRESFRKHMAKSLMHALMVRLLSLSVRSCSYWSNVHFACSHKPKNWARIIPARINTSLQGASAAGGFMQTYDSDDILLSARASTDSFVHAIFSGPL